MTTLADSATGQFGFGYDALSRRTSLTRPNGVNTAYSYDSLSRLLSVLHQAGTNTIDGAAYTYDNAGNRLSKLNYLNNVTENYTYDPLYQLTQVQQGLTTTESYSYDPVGNRLSSLGMSPYTYNSSNQLLSTPQATYTYDANGNTLTKTDSSGTTTYGWDFENRLTSVALPGNSGTVTLRYDPMGRRVAKSASDGSIVYLHDNDNGAVEADATGLVVTHFTQTLTIDESLAELRAGASGYYLQDGLGSVVTLTDINAAPLTTYSYNAFGELRNLTGSFGNSIQYTGREVDSQIGLMYYRARYYDSALGRFLSEDPVSFAGGLNFYAYVRNDPTDLVDSLGLSPRPVKPYRWRDCSPPEETYCKILCKFEGKEFESCSVGQRKRIESLKRGPQWLDHIGPPSCSCKEPPCEKQVQRQPETSPLANPFDWANRKMGYPFDGPFWDRVRDWQRAIERGPQPLPGWISAPGAIPGSMPIPTWQWLATH